jgi:hypothetical protein
MLQPIHVLAADRDGPVRAQLGAGITAGWLGFGMFKLVVAGMRNAATQFLESTERNEM